MKNKIILILLTVFTLVFFFQVISAELLWTVNAGGVSGVWGSATCDVATARGCPWEMGWEGNTITYKFFLPANVELESKVVFVIGVNYRNYGTNKNVLLNIAAGSDSRALSLVNPSFPIDRTGDLPVTIDSSLFKKGTTNYIRIIGTNVNPYGYGTNPPNRPGRHPEHGF